MPKDGDQARIVEQIDFYRAEAAIYDRWLEGRLSGPPVDPAIRRFRSARERVRAVLERLAVRGNVLELAAGTGSFTVLVAEFAERLTLVDSSPESLQLAARRLGQPGIPVHLVPSDIFEWEPPDSKFDVVCFAAWLHHVPWERFDWFWSIVERALSPGGQVVFEFADAASVRSADGLSLPSSPSSDYRAYHRPDDGISIRDLDGRRWTVVHTLMREDELRARLGALGWSLRVETTGWDEGSSWASARRLDAAP